MLFRARSYSSGGRASSGYFVAPHCPDRGRGRQPTVGGPREAGHGEREPQRAAFTRFSSSRKAERARRRPLGAPAPFRLSCSGGGIRTRDLRVMRGPGGFELPQVRAVCERFLGFARACCSQIGTTLEPREHVG